MLAARARSTAKTFDDSAFQVLIWPEGFRGQQLRRQLQQSGIPAPAIDTIFADSVHRLLNAHGIWSYPAEGDTYFDLSLTRLSAVVGPFVTESTREYLRIETLEQLSPTGGDAAVGIPWDSLGNRLASTDRFLATFPDAPTRISIQDRRVWYLRAFLTGWDNTSVFAHDSHQLRPEVRASYQRYLTANGSTASADIVRAFLQLLAENQYKRTPAVTDFLRNRSGIPYH
jgi:hypothetical protein